MEAQFWDTEKADAVKVANNRGGGTTRMGYEGSEIVMGQQQGWPSDPT